jgi:hypothetical protein
LRTEHIRDVGKERCQGRKIIVKTEALRDAYTVKTSKSNLEVKHDFVRHKSC